jgi:hypothetical protein
MAQNYRYINDDESGVMSVVFTRFPNTALFELLAL